jgi:TrmH family RNA methyltransferase
MTITSPHNEKLKEIRKLSRQRRQRAQLQRFVAEGEDLLAAADAAGWLALERYCASGSGLKGAEVEPKLLDSVSGLGSGTRTLAVYEERWEPAPLGPICVYLHGIHDPGNVGAVLRSAQAFGASSVVLGPGSADPYGPKAVRASMGAVFGVPLARASEIDELPGATVALVAGSGVALQELHGAGLEQIALLIGGERQGLPDELVAGADHVAQIPIQTDSLNAAMAATVALYEVTRMARA